MPKDARLAEAIEWARKMMSGALAERVIGAAEKWLALGGVHYYLVKKGSGNWARVWVFHDGAVLVLGAWGSFGYWWSHTGVPDIRQFLISCETDYLAEKFRGRRPKEYDGDATEKAIRDHIDYLEREDLLTLSQASDEQELLNRQPVAYSSDFALWYQETAIREPNELAIYRCPSHITGFLDFMWPEVVAAMRAELEQEHR